MNPCLTKFMKSPFKLSSNLDLGTILKIILLFLIFGFFKGIAYIAPLGIAKFLNSSQVYGEFEYAINIGTMLTSFFLAGLLGSYGYFVLKNNDIHLKSIFHAHFFILTFFLLLVSLLYPKILSNSIFGAIIIAVTFADQILISGILKGNERNNMAIIVDTGIYLIMFAIVILLSLNFISYSHKLWHLSLLTFLCSIAFLYHLPKCKNILNLDTKTIITVYKFGGFVLLTGPLLVLIANSTRVFIEYFTTYADVGKYSLHFRFAALSLIFYRVLSILIFKKLFISKHKDLDKIFSFLVLGIFFFNLFLFFFAPGLIYHINPAFSKYISGDSKLFLLCFFQITFWINISLFESAFPRENKVKDFIVLLIFFAFLFITTLWIVNKAGYLNLELILIINNTILFLVFFGQQKILKDINIRYTLTTNLHSLIGVVYFCSVFYFYYFK